MESKFIMPFIIIATLVFLIILLINSIEAHHVERAWFTAGALLCMSVALIMNLLKIF